VRLLTDENIPAALVRALRAAGYDVLSASEAFPSSGDEWVLARAREEDRVLITFDSDFGRMIFAEGHAPPRGVVYLRSPPPSPTETVTRVLKVLAADAPVVDGCFVSVDATSRFHPLPGRSIND
jgi:predicted nuclease of predicted toxin-antitoxin system